MKKHLFLTAFSLVSILASTNANATIGVTSGSTDIENDVVAAVVANANTTYSYDDVNYITISKWCKTWLWEKYKKKSRYAPNGINSSAFMEHKRNLNKTKIRILIEGDSFSMGYFVGEGNTPNKIEDKLEKSISEMSSS